MQAHPWAVGRAANCTVHVPRDLTAGDSPLAVLHKRAKVNVHRCASEVRR